MTFVKSTKDLNSHVRQDEDAKNMHTPFGFLGANKGEILWKDETENPIWIKNPVVPAVLDFVSSIAAPPTEVDGDTYLLNAAGAILDVDTILFQSGNTIRYTFNGTPDLSGVAVDDFLTVKLAGKTINNGTFKITTVNDGSDFIEVTNALRSDATDDEASDSPATGEVTDELWDGATPNSWVKFSGATGLWGFIDAFIGLLTDDLTVGEQRRFDGTTWAIMTSLSGGGTLNKIARWTGTASLGNSIMTEAGTVLAVAGGFGVTSATNNKAIDDASSNALFELDVFSQNDTFITSDDGAGAKGYMYVGDDFVELFGGVGVLIGLYSNNLLLMSGFALSTDNHVAHIYIPDNSAGDKTSSNFGDNQAGTFLARNSTIKSGVTNTGIGGGVGITAKTDDSWYVNQLGFFESGTIEGLFRAGTLTADRVWELPDIGGQIPVELMAAFQLSSPSASEDAGGVRFNTNVTIGKIVAVIVGSGTDITWTLRHSTDRNATGNEVITGGTTTSNKTTGQVITSFNDATIPVDSWLWLETTAKSGNLNWLNVTAFYTYDI